MKIPLAYQRTEYDCGPAALLNAVSFLFERGDIPPDVLRYVMMYTLDSFNEKGEDCKNGTSRMAMMFLSNWLNQYAKARKIPLNCVFIDGDDVTVDEHSAIVGALQQGGAAVVRVNYDCDHYVTLTGVSGRKIELFDPYYAETEFICDGVEIIADKPRSANRRVDFGVFAGAAGQPYSLETEETREAVLLFNTATRRTPERTIEYFL